MTMHGATRTLGSRTYSVDGFFSKEACLREIYRMAYSDGWEPPVLREKWWQFWRPVQHPEVLRDMLSPPGTPGEQG